MTLRPTLVACLMLSWTCGEAAVAVQPCCDGPCHHAPPNPVAPGRPSPPPCCADGYCYPNPTTWGHYATRWRRWPIEHIEPMPPGVQPPAALGPDAPGYVLPPPEEEDRRAPLPIPEREPPAEATPPAPREPAGEAPAEPAAPAGRGVPTRPAMPFMEPSEDTPTTSPLDLGEPTEETPTTMPLTPPSDSGAFPMGSPLGQATGDADPPPALPFRAPAIGKRTATRSAGGPSVAAPQSQDDPRNDAADDPPPALPGVLARLSN
jgi:hypothetical protein